MLYLLLISIKRDPIMFSKLKSLKFFQSDTTLMQLFRTYVVGAINLMIGLTLTYMLQFLVLTFIEFNDDTVSAMSLGQIYLSYRLLPPRFCSCEATVLLSAFTVN